MRNQLKGAKKETLCGEGDSWVITQEGRQEKGGNRNGLQAGRLERYDKLASLTVWRCGREQVEMGGINTEGVIGE